MVKSDNFCYVLTNSLFFLPVRHRSTLSITLLCATKSIGLCTSPATIGLWWKSFSVGCCCLIIPALLKICITILFRVLDLQQSATILLFVLLYQRNKIPLYIMIIISLFCLPSYFTKQYFIWINWQLVHLITNYNTAFNLLAHSTIITNASKVASKFSVSLLNNTCIR